MRNFQPFLVLSLSLSLMSALFASLSQWRYSPCSFSPVRAPRLSSSTYFFLPLPDAHPLALAFFVAFYNRVQRCGASQFHRGRGTRASPSRRIVATGNSPLRLQKCCPWDTAGTAAGGWRLGGLLEAGCGLRAEGGERYVMGRGRGGGGVVRTLCQELSASGKNSIPWLKGMTRSSGPYSRSGNFRESSCLPSPPHLSLPVTRLPARLRRSCVRRRKE